MTPLPDRSRPRRRLVGRAGIVAAVVGVTMLGNLRLQASEIGHPLATRAAGTGVLAARSTVAAFSGIDADGTMGDAVPNAPRAAERIAAVAGDRGDAESPEQPGLVPAIYAWDKDVRFVYYRHVSKWM